MTAVSPTFFDLDTDDDFGDFEFATSSSSLPPQILTNYADNDWGGFFESAPPAKPVNEVNFDFGQRWEAGEGQFRNLSSSVVIGEGQSSNFKAEEPVVDFGQRWEKPSGPLSLSLFGGDDEEEGGEGHLSNFGSFLGSSVDAGEGQLRNFNSEEPIVDFGQRRGKPSGPLPPSLFGTGEEAREGQFSNFSSFLGSSVDAGEGQLSNFNSKEPVVDFGQRPQRPSGPPSLSLFGADDEEDVKGGGLDKFDSILGSSVEVGEGQNSHFNSEEPVIDFGQRQQKPSGPPSLSLFGAADEEDVKEGELNTFDYILGSSVKVGKWQNGHFNSEEPVVDFGQRQQKPSGPLSRSLFGAADEEDVKEGELNKFDSILGSSVEVGEGQNSHFNWEETVVDFGQRQQKPSGPLSLSLFGADDEDDVKEGELNTFESILSSSIKPGSKNTEISKKGDLKDLIFDLYEVEKSNAQIADSEIKGDTALESENLDDDFDEDGWDFKFAPSVANGVELFDAPLKEDDVEAIIPEVGAVGASENGFFFKNEGKTSSLEDLFTHSWETQRVDSSQSATTIASHAHIRKINGTAKDEEALSHDKGTLKLRELVDFYSILKELSCSLALRHIDNLKSRTKQEVVTIKEPASFSLDSEEEVALKRLGLSDPTAVQIEKKPQDEVSLNELRERLKDSGLQDFDQEFNLTEKISLAENGLSSAMWLFDHASAIIHLFRQFSSEEQSFYLSIWSKMVSQCLLELNHGAIIWSKAVSADVQADLLSRSQGQRYFLSLGEIYRVVQILSAAIRIYRPWLLVNAVDSKGILRDIDKSDEVWKDSKLVQALGLASSVSIGLKTASEKLVESFNSISNLDVEALRRHISDDGVDLCRLSLLPLDILPEISPVVWDDNRYFSKVANFWKNRVSRKAPTISMVDSRIY